MQCAAGLPYELKHALDVGGRYELRMVATWQAAHFTPQQRTSHISY
jgi:hypothetical protein